MKTSGLCPQVIQSCREGAYKQAVQYLVIRASVNVLNILQQQHGGGIQGYQEYILSRGRFKEAGISAETFEYEKERSHICIYNLRHCSLHAYLAKLSKYIQRDTIYRVYKIVKI